MVLLISLLVEAPDPARLTPVSLPPLAAEMLPDNANVSILAVEVVDKVTPPAEESTFVFTPSMTAAMVLSISLVAIEAPIVPAIPVLEFKTTAIATPPASAVMVGVSIASSLISPLASTSAPFRMAASITLAISLSEPVPAPDKLNPVVPLLWLPDTVPAILRATIVDFDSAFRLILPPVALTFALSIVALTLLSIVLVAWDAPTVIAPVNSFPAAIPIATPPASAVIFDSSFA